MAAVSFDAALAMMDDRHHALVENLKVAASFSYHFKLIVHTSGV